MFTEPLSAPNLMPFFIGLPSFPLLSVLFAHGSLSLFLIVLYDWYEIQTALCITQMPFCLPKEPPGFYPFFQKQALALCPKPVWAKSAKLFHAENKPRVGTEAWQAQPRWKPQKECSIAEENQRVRWKNIDQKQSVPPMKEGIFRSGSQFSRKKELFNITVAWPKKTWARCPLSQHARLQGVGEVHVK